MAVWTSASQFFNIDLGTIWNAITGLVNGNSLGVYTQVSVNAPSVGQQVTILTVPAGKYARIISVRYSLGTSATVATRRSNLEVTNSDGIIVKKAMSTVTQTASQTLNYFWGGLQNFNAIVNQDVTQALGRDTEGITIDEGGVLRTQTDGMQVNDSYVVISVEYYLVTK